MGQAVLDAWAGAGFNFVVCVIKAVAAAYSVPGVENEKVKIGQDNMDSKVSRGWKSGLRPIPETSIRRGIAVLLSAGAIATVAYFTASTWAIRHESITFYDSSRDDRPVAVDIAVRRDKQMQASAG